LNGLNFQGVLFKRHANNTMGIKCWTFRHSHGALTIVRAITFNLIQICN
jgi:hypothetical protein